MNIKSRVRDKDGNVFNSVTEFFLLSPTVNKSQLNNMLNNFIVMKGYKSSFCNALMDNNFVKAYNLLVEKWVEEEWESEFCEYWNATIEETFKIGDKVMVNNFDYVLWLGSDDSFLAGLPYEYAVHYSYMRAPERYEEYHIVHLGKRTTPMGKSADTAYIEDGEGKGYIIDVRGLGKIH